MPISAAALPWVIGGLGASSVASGYLAGRSKKQTTTQKTEYTPEQLAIQKILGPLVQSRLENPSADLAPARTSATRNINKTYGSINDRMEQALTQRGFGRGGKLALNTRTIEMGRAGDLSDLEAKLAMYQQDYEQQGFQNAMGFAFGSPSGATSTTTGPSTAAASGIGGGVETATLLYALSKMLGKGGGGGGSDWFYNAIGTPR